MNSHSKQHSHVNTWSASTDCCNWCGLCQVQLELLGPFFFILFIYNTINSCQCYIYFDTILWKHLQLWQSQHYFFWKESMNNSMHSSGDRLISMGLWSPCSPEMNSCN
jgi:hypothetical protein